MKTRLFALFTAEDTMESPAFLFHERRDAERAIQACLLKAPRIVSFSCHTILKGMMNGILYLALRIEDAGVRVIEAFRSPFALHAFLLDRTGEGRYCAGMAWLEPVLQNGHLVFGLDRNGCATLNEADLEPLQRSVRLPQSLGIMGETLLSEEPSYA